jgi:hypothetical protein
MLARRSLPLSLIVTVFLVSIAAVPFSRKLIRSSSPIPSTIPELMQSIRKSAPHLHIVLLRDHLPDEGIYLCERPYPRERLRQLLRVPECAHHWRGIVYGERADRLGVIPPEELASWGEYSMQIGPLLFFGDPALLEYIRQALHATDGGDTELTMLLDGVVPRKAAQHETPLRMRAGQFRGDSWGPLRVSFVVNPPACHCPAAGERGQEKRRRDLPIPASGSIS